MKSYRDTINKVLSQREHLVRQVKEEKQILSDAKDRVQHVQEAQKVLQEIAQQVQEQAHDRIASVVSRCLEAVFDDPYEFRIVFEQKRGRTEARLVFVREGLELNPLRHTGGGVVDVAGFALRVACLALKQPRQRMVLILDEPFKHLSADYRPRVRHLLEVLSVDMGIQFIMVTHSKALQTGKVITIGE